MSSALRPSTLLCAALVLSSLGCAQADFVRRSEALDLRLPLRVAVLPFTDAAQGDGSMAGPAAAIVDVNPLLTEERLSHKHAAQILRGKLVANLARTDLEVLSPLVVDDQLRRDRGLALVDRGEHALHLGQALGVDLVVFGAVTEWDRHYVVLASWVSVGLELDVRDARSGRSVYLGRESALESSGIHKGMVASDPTQVLTLALGETMYGLRNLRFAGLSNEVTRATVESLLGAPSLARPRLTNLAARWVGSELRVVALGTAKARARVAVPDQGWVPMSESAPGVYQLSLEASPAPEAALQVELIGRRQRTRASVVPGARP